MVRDKTVSVIRDGEYRYWEINRFRENAKRIVKRRLSCLAKTTGKRARGICGRKTLGMGVARMMKCVCPGLDIAWP